MKRIKHVEERLGTKRNLTRLTMIGTVVAICLFRATVAEAFSQMNAKGLYFASRAHIFSVDEFNRELVYEGGKYTGDWYDADLSRSWDFEYPQEARIYGSLGACVYDNSLYCFFTTEDDRERHELWRVKVNPSTGAGNDAVKMLGLDQSTGAAAAVLRDKIYVFTTERVIRSNDGENFSCLKASIVPANAKYMIDAATIFPADGSAPQILLAYVNDSDELVSTLFSTDETFSTPVTLPYSKSDPLFGGNLTLGTREGGVKALAVQLYGFSKVKSEMDLNPGGEAGNWEYDVAKGSWTENSLNIESDVVCYGFATAPWFVTINSTKGSLLQEHFHRIVFRRWESPLETNYFSEQSDYLIPQNNDDTYGWKGTPTHTNHATGDDDKSKKLRALWSLVGVVLGPPPFAINAASDPTALSSVTYGIDEQDSVAVTQTTTQTVSVGTDATIQAGIGEFSLDCSYAHGWMSSNTDSKQVETSTYYTFGPVDESAPDYGTHGWALFNAPIILTQKFKVYAYDDETYLGQSMYTISYGKATTQTVYFSLANPADGSIQDLFAGMTTFPNSTDVAGWHKLENIYNWNDGGDDWTEKFGYDTNPSVNTLNQGTGTTSYYSKTETKVTSKGSTNSFSVEADASFDIFEGFSAGVKVGYDTEFETSTELSTSVTKSVSCSLQMPIPPDTDGYVKGLEIQPYWLQATSKNAPWIPDGYEGNLPWCLTWDVVAYEIINDQQSGVSPEPSKSAGAFKFKAGTGQGNYQLFKGDLCWIDSGGEKLPLSMTADDFDADKRASVNLNGYTFNTEETDGSWSRKGDAWSFRSKRGGGETPFELDLDFGENAWTFKGSFADEATSVTKLTKRTWRVILSLQDKYMFRTPINHDYKSSWKHVADDVTSDDYAIEAINGSYDSEKKRGKLTIKGKAPTGLTSFGDVSMEINGQSVSFPIMSSAQFLERLDNGSGSLSSKADGLAFKLNLKNGKWQAKIHGAAFTEDMAPQEGVVSVKILVGGETALSESIEIENYTLKLRHDAERR